MFDNKIVINTKYLPVAATDHDRHCVTTGSPRPRVRGPRKDSHAMCTLRVGTSARGRSLISEQTLVEIGAFVTMRESCLFNGKTR